MNFKKLAGLIGLGLVARHLAYRGPMATPVSEPPTGLLDMHCHVAGIGAGESGAWIAPAMEKSWKFPFYLKIFETTAKELENSQDMSAAQVVDAHLENSKFVDDAVILALDSPYLNNGEEDRSLGELGVPNRLVLEMTKRFPRLHFGASVHPNRLDALEELDWCKKNGAVLLKWLPNIQGIDPSDERFIPFYEKLVELDLPLLSHVGAEDSFSKADDRLGDPHLLRLPLECGVRVIAAHVGSSGTSDGQDNVERLLEMMPTYPNLVADISTLTQMNRRKYLKKILHDPRLKGRLMYGTDHPLTNTPMVSPLQYFLNLPMAKLLQIWGIKNPWDRDVRLKAALGVPPEVFTFGRDYLGL